MIKRTLPYRFFSLLASLQLTVIALVCLSVLVVWGTFYQVDNGIYAAQERFFRAWFILVGGVFPFPAVKTIIAVLTVNLIAAAFKKRPITIKTIGLIVLHGGVIVLVGGSAIASHFTREAAVTLSEGQATDTAYDFTSWQLAIRINGIRDGVPGSETHLYDFKQLHSGQQIDLSPTMTRLSLRHVYRNCGALLNPNDSQTIIGLKPVHRSKDQERNIPGIIYSIDAHDDENPIQNPNHYLYAGSLYPSPFAYGSDTIILSLRPRPLPLPLRIHLTRFSAEWHPGTSKAKSFQSRLRILGKNIDREVVVEMNRPFRYRSFTFYQMGYAGSENNYTSTFAIVKNPLRYMPYIASLIIVVGLFFHFIVKMWFELTSVKRNRHE